MPYREIHGSGKQGCGHRVRKRHIGYHCRFLGAANVDAVDIDQNAVTAATENVRKTAPKDV